MPRFRRRTVANGRTECPLCAPKHITGVPVVEGVSFELQLADKDPPFFDAHGVEVHVLRERTQSSEPPHEPADVCRSVGRGCGGWSGRVDHLFSAAVPNQLVHSLGGFGRHDPMNTCVSWTVPWATNRCRHRPASRRRFLIGASVCTSARHSRPPCSPPRCRPPATPAGDATVCVKFRTDSGEKVWNGCGEMGERGLSPTTAQQPPCSNRAAVQLRRGKPTTQH